MKFSAQYKTTCIRIPIQHFRMLRFHIFMITWYHLPPLFFIVKNIKLTRFEKRIWAEEKLKVKQHTFQRNFGKIVDVELVFESICSKYRHIILMYKKIERSSKSIKQEDINTECCCCKDLSFNSCSNWKVEKEICRHFKKPSNA